MTIATSPELSFAHRLHSHITCVQVLGHNGIVGDGYVFADLGVVPPRYALVWAEPGPDGQLGGYVGDGPNGEQHVADVLSREYPPITDPLMPPVHQVRFDLAPGHPYLTTSKGRDYVIAAIANTILARADIPDV